MASGFYCRLCQTVLQRFHREDILHRAITSQHHPKANLSFGVCSPRGIGICSGRRINQARMFVNFFGAENRAAFRWAYRLRVKPHRVSTFAPNFFVRRIKFNDFVNRGLSIRKAAGQIVLPLMYTLLRVRRVDLLAWSIRKKMIDSEVLLLKFRFELLKSDLLGDDMTGQQQRKREAYHQERKNRSREKFVGDHCSISYLTGLRLKSEHERKLTTWPTPLRRGTSCISFPSRTGKDRCGRLLVRHGRPF